MLTENVRGKINHKITKCNAMEKSEFAQPWNHGASNIPPPTRQRSLSPRAPYLALYGNTALRTRLVNRKSREIDVVTFSLKFTVLLACVCLEYEQILVVHQWLGERVGLVVVRWTIT